MKRVVNDIPLVSVIGLMPGFTKVVVEDRKLSKVYCDNAEDTEKWEGLAKDFWYASDAISYKWGRSKVYEMRPLKDSVMIVISTQFEQY